MFEFQNMKFKDILTIPSLCIQKERITSLIGQSGSGKTTILKMLNKMLSPTEGAILYEGNDLSALNSVQHRRHVTMLSQAPAIFEGTVKDNLVMGLKLQKRELPTDEALLALLGKVKLNKELESPAHTLSGGEKQRLALGRVLLLNSPVYLLDEPSSALDDETAESIIQMITEHVRTQKKTLVMVTHSKAIAEQYSDAIIKVNCGQCSLWRGNHERNH